MLYIRERIGKDETDQLLIVFGLLGNGGSSPLEPDWKCPGPPAAPGIEAEECKGTASARATMFRGNEPEHPFHGFVLCTNCRSKMCRRELAILEELKSKGKLPEAALQERLKELQVRLRCNHEGCENGAVSGGAVGLCIAHGGGLRCKSKGCKNGVVCGGGCGAWSAHAGGLCSNSTACEIVVRRFARLGLGSSHVAEYFGSAK